MIDKFEGKYEFLSNFYESPLRWRGNDYPTVEHAFQAAKTLDPIYRQAIATADTPGKAKRLGRKANLRPDWEEIKEQVMYECVSAKFSQSISLMLALLATGDEELVEGTTGWHDNEWGSCSCPKCINIEGKNKLGKILMRVREEILAKLEELVKSPV
jgi:ribA/ribD-fused uncharacterized protein